jgi:hypothetical protein
MAADQTQERLKHAREELRRACSLLSSPSPEAMAACGRALKGAVGELQTWLQETPPEQRDREAVAEVAELRRSVQQAQRLLQAAAEYHSNWLQQICLMAGGYSSDGRPATVEPSAHVAVQA